MDNTLVVTFGNDRQQQFSVNWVFYMQLLGVRGLLVCMMNMNASMPSYVQLSARLRALGVGVYLVNSPEVAIRPQGGRWYHVVSAARLNPTRRAICLAGAPEECGPSSSQAS